MDTKINKATKKGSKTDKVNAKKVENMKALALLVKEVIETGLPKQPKTVKVNKEVHPGVRCANNVIKGLSSANCKIEYYLVSYANIHTANRKQILKSEDDLYWMTEKVIKAELGESKNGVCLNLSMAMNSAMKMRKAIEMKKYANPNDKDEAYGNYKYGYVNLLHYRFLVVVIDSLPDGHKDISALSELVASFKSNTHLCSDSSSGDDSDESKPSIGKTATEIAGEKMSSKSIEKMIGTFANNAAAFEKVKDVVTNLKATEGNPLENTELLTSTVTSIAPIFNNMFTEMAKSQQANDSNSEESESGSEDS